MGLNCTLITALLLLVAITCSEAALLQRRQREVQTAEAEDEHKDQIPVAVIEVQEPDTVVQSLQVDTLIQTTDNTAAEIEREIDEALPAEAATVLHEPITEADKAQTLVQITATDVLANKGAEFEEKIASFAPQVTEELVQQMQDQHQNQHQDQELAASEPVKVVEQEKSNEAAEDEAIKQATPATPVLSTTPQNFVQFIQASPIGQFFSQLTAGQAPAGAAADEPGATPAPTVPVFLNPAAAYTQAQQVVQNAAQSVVNTTTQAFQGLQQFASNIGNQFQNTLSSLSGQTQLSASDSSTQRPQGPIQSVINNLVPTVTPGQPQGPLQGIISFFQGGQRPQNANNNNNNNNNAAGKPPIDKPTKIDNNATPIDDKIENQEPDVANEVRNSEEALDSFEEDPNGPALIVVNDDRSSVTPESAIATI